MIVWSVIDQEVTVWLVIVQECDSLVCNRSGSKGVSSKSLGNDNT